MSNGAYGKINPTDYPVGTELIVNFGYLGHHQAEKKVKVLEWTYLGDSVKIEFLDKSTISDWYYVADISVLTEDKEETVHLNKDNHPIGAKLIIKGCYDDSIIKETAVEIVYYNASKTAVLLRKLNNALWFDNDECANIELWFNVKNVEVVEIIPTTATMPSIYDMPIGRLFVINCKGIESIVTKETQVKKDTPPRVKLCVQNPDSPRMDTWFNINDITIVRFVDKEKPKGEPMTKEELDQASLMFAHPDELKKDFFHHMEMVKKIADSLGYKVEVTFIS